MDALTPTPFPFEQFRRLRSGGALPACPHCAATRVHRWGTFSGRQRYRCLVCERTFSDFTGTPLAALKLVDRWPDFCRCMLASMTVREAARYLGVDKNTAFRWRHRLLRALDASDCGPLGSTVVIHETSFPFSEKGKRGLERPPRRRRATGWFEVPSVWAYIASDDAGRIASGVVGQRRPMADDLQAALAPRLGTAGEIVSSIGPYGAAGLLAVRLERAYRRAEPGAPEMMVARRYIMAMRRWLKHFHGVATRYLSNYLAWHRFLEAGGIGAAGAGQRVGHRLLLAARFP
ncbi:MAG: IS1595 family transposase [Longimicrobiales bacterium]